MPEQIVASKQATDWSDDLGKRLRESIAMSIQVMTAVWAEAPYEGGALIVLLALAAWADDESVAVIVEEPVR